MTVDIEQQDVPGRRRCEVCGGPRQARCGTCAERTRDRRRGEALQLVRRGTPMRRAARATGVDRGTLARALAADSSAATIPNAELRRAVDRVMQREGLSLSEIARRAEPAYSGGATQVARLIGRIRTARCRRGERVYPPRYRTEVSIDDAVRVARAAGIDPIDIEGL
jgi:hypothetical protein